MNFLPGTFLKLQNFKFPISLEVKDLGNLQSPFITYSSCGIFLVISLSSYHAIGTMWKDIHFTRFLLKARSKEQNFGRRQAEKNLDFGSYLK